MRLRIGAFLRTRFWFIELGYLTIILPAIFIAGPYTLILLAGVLVLWILRFALTGRFVPQTPLNLTILVLSIAILMSVLVTPNMSWSLPKVAGIVWGISFYFAVVSATSSSARALRTGVFIYFLLGILFAIAAWLGTDWQGDEQQAILYDFLGEFEQFANTPSGIPQGFNPNQVAGILILFFPVSVYLFYVTLLQIRHSQNRSLLLIAFFGIVILTTILQGVILLLTKSRGSWVGLVGALVFLLIILNPRESFKYIATIMFGTIAGALFLSRSLEGGLLELLYESVQSIFSGRLEHWSRALSAIRLAPLTGLGMNIYRNTVHVMYPRFLVPQGVDIPHAHNMWLQAQLDLGLSGLIAYLALLIVVVSVLVSVQTHPYTSWVTAFSRGALVGVVAYVFFGFVDTVALGAKPGIVFWILLGLIVSLHGHLRDKPAATELLLRKGAIESEMTDT